MLKKSITFTNHNGTQVTEDHYFHLSRAAIIKLQHSTEGGYDKRLERIIESEDGAAIIQETERLIELAYGEKSEDGSRFDQSPEIFAKFQASPAYDELFTQLCTNAESAAEFYNGLMPKELVDQAAQVPDKPQLKPVEGGPRGVRAGVPQDTGHPSDTAGQTAPTPATDLQPPAEEPKNETEVREITVGEAAQMDPAELQGLLTSGKARMAGSEG